MKDIINLLTLSPYISTSFHLNEFNSALDRLQAAYFQKKQTFVQALDEEVPFPLSETLKKLAIEHEVNLESTEDVDAFMSKIRDEIQNISTLTITLSIQPKMSLIRVINDWIIHNLKQVVVLDFVVDYSLIAGAKIAFNGKISDHSITQEMAETIKMSI